MATGTIDENPNVSDRGDGPQGTTKIKEYTLNHIRDPTIFISHFSQPGAGAPTRDVSLD